MDSGRVGAGLAVALVFVAWCSPVVSAQDAGVYRGFRLGMTVAEATERIGPSAAAAKVVFERPFLIEEIEWRPRAAGLVGGSGQEPESVAVVALGFFKGALYRIVVSYDPDRTEGMTDQDLIEALSAQYGPAQTPVARIITSPLRQQGNDSAAVLARWQDDRASVNMFKGSYRSTYGLVIYSKAVAPAARAAIEQGLLLDRLDAPRRELAEEQARAATAQRTHAKARAANKAAFRF